MKTTELFVEQTWAWWRTTETFMQFLRDFRKFARKKES